MNRSKLKRYHDLQFNGVLRTDDGTPVRTVYVSYLSRKITTKVLLEYFAPFGAVESIKMHRNAPPKLPFAFVTFISPDTVSIVLRRRFHPFLAKHAKVNIADSWHQPKATPPSITSTGAIDAYARGNNCKTSSILEMNDDCLLYICKYLGLLDLVNLAETCARMNAVVNIELLKYSSIDLSRYNELDDQFTCTRLNRIFKHCRSHIQQLKMYGGCIIEPHNHYIDLILNNLCNLVELHLFGIQIKQSIDHLTAELSKLKRLSLIYCQGFSNHFLRLTPALEQLNIEWKTEFTGSGIACLINLHEISLKQCKQLPGDVFEFLKIDSKITRITYKHCCLTESAGLFVAFVPNLKSLQHLETDCLEQWPVANMDSLKRLNVTNISEKCLPALAAIANRNELEELVVHVNSRNMSGVHRFEEILLKFTKLNVLAIDNCKGINESVLIELIGRLDRLRHLDCVSIVENFDNFTRILALSPHLESINLTTYEHTKAAEQTIRQIAEMYKLSPQRPNLEIFVSPMWKDANYIKDVADVRIKITPSVNGFPYRETQNDLDVRYRLDNSDEDDEISYCRLPSYVKLKRINPNRFLYWYNGQVDSSDEDSV